MPKRSVPEPPPGSDVRTPYNCHGCGMEGFGTPNRLPYRWTILEVEHVDRYACSVKCETTLSRVGTGMVTQAKQTVLDATVDGLQERTKGVVGDG